MTIVITGASGSAGGSVLRVCLADPQVTAVLAIVRRPLGTSHPKLREVIHADYLDYGAIRWAFAGADACFHCLGKSVGQVSGEVEYRRITYDLALAAAAALREASPSAVFHYISGQGADLASRFMWARVKAEAERDLIARYDAVCWRPGSIDGMPSSSEPVSYKLLRPVMRTLLSWSHTWYVTGADIGRAMLKATRDGVRARIIENAEIRQLAVRR